MIGVERHELSASILTRKAVFARHQGMFVRRCFIHTILIEFRQTYTITKRRRESAPLFVFTSPNTVVNGVVLYKA